MKDVFWSALLSISPLGEAKVGIPYALVQGVNIYITFAICLLANILVFPLMLFFLKNINRYLFKFRTYKRSAIFVAKRARDGAKNGIHKYGYWGLIFFVMLPIPGTGVYAGTIASYIFRFNIKKAFIANTIGITLSSLIVWSISVASINGFGPSN